MSLPYPNWLSSVFEIFARLQALALPMEQDLTARHMFLRIVPYSYLLMHAIVRLSFVL